MKKIILFIILSVSFSSYADEINLLMIPDDPDAVIMKESLNKTVSSGEIVVVDKKLDDSQNDEVYFGKITNDCIYDKSAEKWSNNGVEKNSEKVLNELKEKFKW